MKKLFVLLLCAGVLSIPANSQRSKDKEDKSRFDDNDADFKITEVPEKWKGESAVILCQKLSFSYTTVNGIGNSEYHVEEIVRKRIKLQDKAAVEEFSKFYFTGSDVGVRIVKPDGKTNDIDISQAITDDTKVPSIYQSYAVFESYKKLAIPGLEVGDIIDYYYASKNISYGKTGDTRGFRAFIFTLNAAYPIVQQTIFYNVDKNYFINFNSSNGCPELVPGEAGVNYRGKVKEDIKTYVLKDKDREKLADEKWVYNYKNYPTVKFQVVSGSKNAWKDSEFFLGERGTPKTSVTKKEVVLSMSRRLLNETPGEKYFKEQVVPFIVEYIKKKHKEQTNPEILMTEAYYAFRYKYSTVWALGGDARSEYISNDSRAADELFCDVMKAVAKKLKVKIEVFIAIQRNIGTFDKVLVPGELNIGIKAGNVYLSPPSYYSQHTLLDPLVEGCQALVFVPEDDEEKVSFTEITLPATSSTHNVREHKTTVSVLDNMEHLDVKRVSSYKGNYIEYAPVYMSWSSDVALTDRRKYDMDFKEKPYEKMTKSQKEEKDKQDADREEWIKKVKEYKKDEPDGDFEIEEYKNYAVTGLGRTPDEPVFSAEEEYVIKNLVNKAGRNYTITLGALIGEQVEITEKERTRKTDVDMAFAKSVVHDIELKIPDGYTVEGIEELNAKKDSPGISFTSSAGIAGNSLKVKVVIDYKKSHDVTANWKNWTEVLDAAYAVSQKKVVLKKK